MSKKVYQVQRCIADIVFYNTSDILGKKAFPIGIIDLINS